MSLTKNLISHKQEADFNGLDTPRQTYQILKIQVHILLLPYAYYAMQGEPFSVSDLFSNNRQKKSAI